MNFLIHPARLDDAPLLSCETMSQHQWWYSDINISLFQQFGIIAEIKQRRSWFTLCLSCER